MGQLAELAHSEFQQSFVISHTADRLSGPARKFADVSGVPGVPHTLALPAKGEQAGRLRRVLVLVQSESRTRRHDDASSCTKPQVWKRATSRAGRVAKWAVCGAGTD